MAADELRVRGGTGGVTARLDDLRHFATVADDIGDELGEAAFAVGALGMDADVLASAALSPATAAQVQARMVAAATRLGTSVLELRAQGAGLRLTADALEALDAASSFGQEVGQSGWGLLAIGGGLGRTFLGSPFAFGGNLLEATGEAVATGFDEGFAAFFDAMASAPSEAGLDTWSDIGGYWSDLLLDTPHITNVVVTGLTQLGTDRWLSYPETVREIIARGGLLGWFDDGWAISVAPADMDALTGRALENTVVPRSLEDLFTNQRSLMSLALADPDGSRLRVIEVPGSDGSSWIVQVPGTQAWDLQAGADPADLTTNLHLSGAADAALLDAIDAALRSHGVGDDPVMIVGHSQGGIAAGAYATQAASRGHNVTHVVTGGSPIAYLDIPDHVQVLAIEHHNDLVPRLDGAVNPDRSNWTTVVRDVGGSDSTEYGGLLGPHGAGLYGDTAGLIDRTSDPSVQRFLDGSAPFFAGTSQDAVGSGLVQDHVIRREVRP